MMRNPPPESPPELSRKLNPSRIVMKREYQLLTPLYGGGVEAGKPDLNTPIRGTTIRGQLRFWWRATRGGVFDGDRDRMKAMEDRIWGSTNHQSQVSIAVVESDPGSRFQPVNRRGDAIDDVGHFSSVDSYAAFPLRGSREKEPGELRQNVGFTLQISFPLDVAEEVRAALWAWDTFGGIGARTRRGFGALLCRSVAPLEGELSGAWRWLYRANELARQLEADVQHFVGSGPFPTGVPYLSRDFRRFRVAQQNQGNNPMEVWRSLINRLQEFRQSRPRYNRRPGRSRWPEPDAIRHLTKRPNPLPPDRQPIYSSRIDKFPRASFGLPIIFEFKNERNARYREPRTTTLIGARYSRLASPLILRPLAVAGGAYIGLGLILEAPRVPPGGLKLKDAPGDPHVDSDLEPDEAAAIRAQHPPNTYDGNVDILQSFLDQL